MGFSIPNFTAQLGLFAGGQADSVILGVLFGPLAVGLYRVAERLVNSLVTVAMASIQAVSLSEFSRLQQAPGPTSQERSYMHTPDFFGNLAGVGWLDRCRKSPDGHNRAQMEPRCECCQNPKRSKYGLCLLLLHGFVVAGLRATAPLGNPGVGSRRNKYRSSRLRRTPRPARANEFADFGYCDCALCCWSFSGHTRVRIHTHATLSSVVSRLRSDYSAVCTRLGQRDRFRHALSITGLAGGSKARFSAGSRGRNGWNQRLDRLVEP